MNLSGETGNISGSTLDAWMDFVINTYGEDVLKRITDGLEPETKEEFGGRISKARTYSRDAFDDFCRGIAVCSSEGSKAGIALGEHSAEKSERILEPIIKSAGNDPVYFLDKRLTSIHRLYVEEGGFDFEPGGNGGSGCLISRGFPHNEMMCYSNAGYTRKCLELMGVSGVKIIDVRHDHDREEGCRIRLSWME